MEPWRNLREVSLGSLWDDKKWDLTGIKLGHQQDHHSVCINANLKEFPVATITLRPEYISQKGPSSLLNYSQLGLLGI